MRLSETIRNYQRSKQKLPKLNIKHEKLLQIYAVSNSPCLKVHCGFSWQSIRLRETAVPSQPVKITFLAHLFLMVARVECTESGNPS